jgi:hypothetical protein
MQRAAAGVDVAAVGRNAHGDDVGSERAEQLRAELEGCAVGAIQNDAETGELRSGNEPLPEEGQIFGVEGLISGKSREAFWDGVSSMLEDIEFELFFNRVGEFHSGVRKQFNAIVLKRIVRSGDDHTGLKVALANKAGYAGGSDHAGKGNSGASLREASSK